MSRMTQINSALRSIMRNKLRAFFTILALVVGSSSFYCMFLLSELAPRSIEDSAKSLLGGDLLIQSYLKPLPAQTVQGIVGKLDGIEGYTGSYVGQSMVKSDDKSSSIIVKGIDPKQYPYYGDHLFPGIRSLQAGEILMVADAADRLHAQTGDSVWMPSASDGTMHKYTVKGIVQSVQESYGDANIFGSAYVTLDEAVNVLNAPKANVNEILIRGKAGADIKQWQEQLTGKLPGVTFVDIKDRTDESLAGAKTVLILLQIFSLLALGISALTISSTMKQAIGTRMRDIAAMKAIGMKKSLIYGIFLTEGLVMGFVGTLVGALIGLFVSIWLNGYLGHMLSIPLEWHFSWKVTVITFVTGLLTAFISTWIPLKGMLKISPLVLLREAYQEFPSYRLSFWKKALGVVLLSILLAFYLQQTLFLGSDNSLAGRIAVSFFGILAAFVLVLGLVKLSSLVFSLLFRCIGGLKRWISPRWFIPFHHLSSGRKQYSLLGLVLAVGVASAVSSILLGDNLTRSVSKQLETEAKGNIIVTSSVKEAPLVTQSLQASGAEDWTEGVQMNGFISSINGKDSTLLFQQKAEENKFFASNKISIEGIDPASSSRTYEMAKGRDLGQADAAKKTVLLVEDYQEIGIHTGDSVEVTLGQKQVSLTVAGFFKSGFVKTVGMRLSENVLYKYGSPTRVLFSVNGGSETSGLMAKLYKELPASAMAYSVSSTASESLNSMIRMISAFFSVVTLFAFLTAVLTIGNQIVINLLKQSKEIAIIKAVGMSNGKTLRSILVENFVLSLFSGIIGTGMALLLTTGALTVLFKLPVQIDLGWVIYGTALCIVVTLAVAWLAARPSLQTKPRELLQRLG